MCETIEQGQMLMDANRETIFHFELEPSFARDILSSRLYVGTNNIIAVLTRIMTFVIEILLINVVAIVIVNALVIVILMRLSNQTIKLILNIILLFLFNIINRHYSYLVSYQNK